MREIPAPAAKVEDTRCDVCKSSIVGVHHHRRGTFVHLCPLHFGRLPSAERAAFDAIESNPLLPPARAHTPEAELSARRCCSICQRHVPAGVMPFRCTAVVTQADILRALEDGTSSELLLRDWDLKGAASVAARQSHSLAAAAL
jgi:hypothetical protein